MSARNRELLGLFPVSLLITAGFTAVFAARQTDLGSASLTYGAIFLVLCLAVHLFIRATLPDADPYLFPLVRAAGGVRPRDDLPDRRRARAPAGRLVRRRHRAVRAPPSCCSATCACWSATGT